MRLPKDDYPWPKPPLRVKRPAIEWVIVFENSSTQVFRLSYICFPGRLTDEHVCEKLPHQAQTYDSPRRINSRPLYR